MGPRYYKSLLDVSGSALLPSRDVVCFDREEWGGVLKGQGR